MCCGLDIMSGSYTFIAAFIKLILFLSSYSGEMDGVETARARVRELTPLIFCFDLPIMASLHATPPDHNDPYLRAIQDQYNIQVRREP